MPEQLAEALRESGIEQPLNRRQAMEAAFDHLSGDGSQEKDLAGDAARPGSGDGKAGKGGEEPLIKVDGVEQVAKPIADKKEVKSLAKPASKVGEKPATAGKPGEKAEVVKAGEKPAVATRAPQSWKPELREKWASIDPAVQETILKREAEITRGLNESAAARRFGGEFYNIVRPFEHLIRASGVTPLQAVDNLVKTAGALQTGTSVQKAQVVANICAAYGVDLKVLDQVLAGQKPKDGAPDPALLTAIDARLKPVTEFMSRVEGGRQQADIQVQREVQQEEAAFAADPKNEFFEDLRTQIADLLDVAAKNNRQMSLQQAYDIACQMDPDVSKVVKERAEAEAATKKAQNFERSRKAASSQEGGAPGNISGKGGQVTGRRNAIEKAWGDLTAG